MEKSKKNVLAIVQTLSKRAGAGRTASEILSRLEHEVNVRTLIEVGSAAEEYNSEAILEPRSPFIGFIRNCFRARRAASGMDVVHAFDAWPYGVYGYYAVVGTKRRLVINGVGTYSVAPFDRLLTRLMVSRAYQRASAILCISQYTKDRIDEKLSGLRTSIMLQGTSALPVPSSEKIAEVRARLDIPENAYPIIVTVGEIKERKGQLDTMQSLASLKKEFPHSLYVMAGSDTDTHVDTIRESAKELGQDIRISSAIKSDEDLASLYSIADIFALNSNNHENHFEGFGLVILEAAQFGVPAIGSKNCGIEDAIENDVSGILTGQMDHTAIAEAIRDILAKHEVFKAGALAWYTRFTWEKTISVILKAYENSDSR